MTFVEKLRQRAASLNCRIVFPETADERVLPGGTAYITDLGMTGPTEGVIGVDRDLILQRFLSQMPMRFEPAKGPAALHGVIIVVDPETGRASDIRRLRVPA